MLETLKTVLKFRKRIKKLIRTQSSSKLVLENNQKNMIKSLPNQKWFF
jgi:hypothetical protein